MVLSTTAKVFTRMDIPLAEIIAKRAIYYLFYETVLPIMLMLK